MGRSRTGEGPTREGKPRARALSTRTIASVVVALAAVAALAAPPAGASDPISPTGPGDTSTSTVPPVVPPTTDPDGPGPSTPTPPPPNPTPPSTTASAPAPTVAPPELPTPTLPPELDDDPRAPYLIDPGPGDGLDIDIAQNSFDPRSVLVNPALVAAAAAEFDGAKADLDRIVAALAERTATLSDLETRLDRLETDTRHAIEAAAEARERLAEHAVRAYVGGDVDEKVALVQADTPTDLGVARHYAGALGGVKERLVRDYRRKSADLTNAQRELASALGSVRSEVTQLTEQEQAAALVVFDKAAQVAAYEAGAHAYVDGFVFPIAAEADFIDSWGFPRSGGRWHQGSDVFAEYGAPLIAAENGVLDRIGSNGLGGLRLWLIGDSGHHYYYAHLAGFAEGIADGDRVNAGEVVGYVGTSGNAVGTPPHLHIEIHPNGAGPVNPYPLLRAAYDARPQLGPGPVSPHAADAQPFTGLGD